MRVCGFFSRHLTSDLGRANLRGGLFEWFLGKIERIRANDVRSTSADFLILSRVYCSYCIRFYIDEVSLLSL